MADWAITNQASRVESGGVNASTGAGTTLTAAATGNTKGNWTELIAALPFDSVGLLIELGPMLAMRKRMIDIGVGAGGSEVVVIPDLMTEDPTPFEPETFIYSWYVPLALPAGARISARQQVDITSSSDVQISIKVFGGDLAAPSAYRRVEALGTVSASTSLTPVDPGASANTKGAWVELAAATTQHASQLLLGVTRNSTALQDAVFLLDIGIGGSGSETVILPNYRLVSSDIQDVPIPIYSPPLPLAIPAGSRVVARLQSSTTDASGRVLQVGVWGIG